MSDADQQGRPEPPIAGDEVATLLGSLERQRATFAWKCGGLDAAGLRATVGVSTITLGGLLKHLALVEDDTFSKSLLGRELGARAWATRRPRRPDPRVGGRARRGGSAVAGLMAA